MCNNDMKKTLIFILILSCFAMVLLTACDDNKENSNGIEYVEKKEETEVNNETNSRTTLYKEYDLDYNEKFAFERVEELTKLTSKNQLNNEEARKLYNLEGKDNYSITVRTNIEDNKIHEDSCEIAIIKVPNTDENMNALMAAANRTKDLINTKNIGDEPFIIEETNGILTIVISKDARIITDILTKELKSEE